MTSSQPIVSSEELGDYYDDAKRTRSVIDDKITAPLHQLQLHHHCPALAAANSLMERDFFVIDDFISPEQVLALRAEVEAYEKQGRMVEGEIGRGSAAGKGSIQKSVRDDFITWLEGSEPFVQKNMRTHILRCDVMAQKIQILFDSIAPHLSWEGAGRTKIMASLYRHSPSSGTAGSKYNPHFDNPVGNGQDNGRRLTMIMYLNPTWKPEDGGRLRVKTKKESVDIAPLGGRLICFWPDRRVPHEVLPAKASDRYAITIWYLDRRARADAEKRSLERQQQETTAAAAASKEQEQDFNK